MRTFLVCYKITFVIVIPFCYIDINTSILVYAFLEKKKKQRERERKKERKRGIFETKFYEILITILIHVDF